MKTKLLLVVALAPFLGFLSGCVDSSKPSVTQATVPPAQVRIELRSPVEWEVFQRKDGTGVVRVVGSVEGVGTKGAKVALYLGPEKDMASPAPRAMGVFTIAGAQGAFAMDLAEPSGGWDTLIVETLIHGRVAEATVKHVGIGEVFVVGGQSNSTNYGAVKQKTATGMVTVFDGKQWTLAADPLPGVDGHGGSPWCLFGDDMVAKLHVPIGIVPVGKGATSVRQWLPKGDIVTIEPSRDYGLTKLTDGTWLSGGQLFDRMVDRMKQLGDHGFRAMLWHQGESDAHQKNGHTLPGTKYRADMERIITDSREQAGWDVPWFVATATWGSPTSPADPDIRAAQQGVVADGVAMAGPDTDTLLGDNRQKNGTGVHMSDIGLHAHAKLWADIVTTWLDALPTSPSK